MNQIIIYSCNSSGSCFTHLCLSGDLCYIALFRCGSWKQCLCVSAHLLQGEKCLVNSYILFGGEVSYMEATSKRVGVACPIAAEPVKAMHVALHVSK